MGDGVEIALEKEHAGINCISAKQFIPGVSVCSYIRLEKMYTWKLDVDLSYLKTLHLSIGGEIGIYKVGMVRAWRAFRVATNDNLEKMFVWLGKRWCGAGHTSYSTLSTHACIISFRVTRNVQ